MPETLTRPDIAALCLRFGLEEDARALLRPEHDERAFVEALLTGEQFADAVRFMAGTLPVREAIWWAWSCARRTLAPGPPPPVLAALELTERWIAQPNEENRRPTLAAAEAADLGTAAGAAAFAAFFSGGSISPPSAPPVPAPAGAAARAVAGSVTLSAVSPPPELAPDRFRQFVAQAMEVAVRIRLWPRA
ncbi:MAG TPA: hypothetical protein VF832_16920 [Longimicrobiales bacterium]